MTLRQLEQSFKVEGHDKFIESLIAGFKIKKLVFMSWVSLKYEKLEDSYTFMKIRIMLKLVAECPLINDNGLHRQKIRVAKSQFGDMKGRMANTRRVSINPDWFRRSGGGRDQVERNIIMSSA